MSTRRDRLYCRRRGVHDLTLMLSVLLRGGGAPGGAEMGKGGAGVAGGAALFVLGTSMEALLVSLAVVAVPFGSWWLFSCGSGSVAERLASASLSAEGASGGAGGAALGGPVALTPPLLTVSDLKNSSRLLCNWKLGET